MMTRIRHASLAVLLCITLILTVTVGVFQEVHAADQYFAGAGTAESPFLIYSAEQLDQLSFLVNSGDTAYSDQTYQLENDIDLSGYANWNPIGSSSELPFKGTFNGNGHKISNLTLTQSLTSPQELLSSWGLFGFNAGTINNTNISECNISITGSGNIQAGSIAGYNSGLILGCACSGEVVSTRSAGGIAGYNCGSILECHNSGNIDSIGGRSGGIAGQNITGNIARCYNAGKIGIVSICGGIAGFNNGTISDCMNLGSIVTTSSFVANLGGIVGYDNLGIIQNCCSYGYICPCNPDNAIDSGGIVGYRSTTRMINCYFLDLEISGVGRSDATNTGTPVPCSWAELGEIEILSGLDFSSTWIMQNINNYCIPTLRSQPLVLPAEDTTSFAGGRGLPFDPYNVSNSSQLNHIRNFFGSCFQLTADISFSETDFSISGEFYGQGEGWQPIGTSKVPFYGMLDGMGHSVANLRIEATDTATDYSRQFGFVGVHAGIIRNLRLTGSSIRITGAGTASIGGIAGENQGGIVRSCSFSGTIYAESAFAIGGIVGQQRKGTISSCYNLSDISADNSTAYLGGIIGWSISESISDCFNAGHISGLGSVGGIAGRESKITSCYNIGMVSGSSNAHGLIGTDSDNARSVDSYYLSGSGDFFWSYNNRRSLTVDQMKQISSFDGFDFEKTWTIDVNSPYAFPTLRSNPFIQTSAGVSDYAGGNGTAFDPYQINSAQQLDLVREKPDAFFVLINDIVFTESDFSAAGAFYHEGTGWQPIGTADRPFSGFFNGNGHKVFGLSINGYVDATETKCFGLFGYCTGIIANLEIASGSIHVYGSGNAMSGAFAGELNTTTIYGEIANCINRMTLDGLNETGGLAGVNNGEITDSENHGNITSSLLYANVGGIAGTNSGAIFGCHNANMVTGSGKAARAGGIAGSTFGSIEECFNQGNISANSCAGGITGYLDTGTVRNCYNLAPVFGHGYSGGIIGYLFYSEDFNYCYNTGLVTSDIYAGGILGANEGPVFLTSYYLDINAIGIGKKAALLNRRTIAEMMQQSTYSNFDFQNVWTMPAQSPYTPVFARDVRSSNALQSMKSAMTKQLADLGKLKPGQDYVDHEIIVKAESLDEARTAAEAYQAKLKKYTKSGYAVLSLSPDKSVIDAVAKGTSLSSDLPVAFPNFRYKISEINIQSIPDDPMITQQYYHQQLGDYQAWELTTGSPQVVVAVIDTGINYNHPDLAGKVSNLSFNAYTHTVGLAVTNDDVGHGSHVAGIIAANRNNATGGSGIAPGVTLLSIKANCTGEAYFTSLSITEGIFYAVENNADIVNMSLGSQYKYGKDLLQEEALNYAASQDVLVVCAAGNDKDDHASYPAAYDVCVAVTAVNASGTFASTFSSHGPEVDLAAPGTDILSVDEAGGYIQYSGTSMAAPMVTAVAALIKTMHPEYTVQQIKQKLYDSAQDKGNPGLDPYYGHGLLNTLNSLSSQFFTISFNCLGGSPVPSYSLASGSYLTCPENPTREGYSFGGWYKDALCSDNQKWIFSTMGTQSTADIVSSDITLFAKWNVNSYVITFNSMNGSAVNSFLAPYGSTINEPTPPTRSGYVFVGWYREPGCQNIWVFSRDTITGHLILYAKWVSEYLSVTFDSAGGSGVEPVTVHYGELLAEPTPPVWIDHIFLYWYADDPRIPWDFSTQVVGDALILRARWVPEHCHVVFMSNGGSSVIDIQAPYGQLIAEPVTPTRTGYTFSGWFQDAGLTAPWSFTTDPVTGDMTLYAKWTINQYTVDFDSQGGSSVTSKVANFSTSITEPDVPSRTGYSFAGWYQEPSCINNWIFETDTVIGNTTLYARWTINQYTVVFNSQGGSSVASKVTNYNTVITAPTAPTRSGYLFVGWYKESGCVNAWGYATDKVTGNTTLYARWLQSPAASLTAVSAGYEGILLKWAATTGANGYEVYRSTSSAGTYVQVATVSSNSFTHGGLSTNTTYYYKIRAFATFGPSMVFSDFSGIASATPIPAAPTGLVAASASFSSIKLTWGAVPGASGYAIYRATAAAGTYTLVISSVTSATYTNASRTTGTTYYYKVKAWRMIGTLKIYGSYSSVASAKPILNVPANFKATSASYSSIKLSWSAVSGANGYAIYRSTSQAGTFTYVGSTSYLTYTNTSRLTGTTYYYKVRAYRLAGTTRIYSNYTGVVSATPLLSTPVTFALARNSATSVKLTWSAVSGRTGYEVWQSLSLTGTYSLVKTTSYAYFTHTGLTAGKTYYYKIRAYRLVGTLKVYSTFTAVKSVTL
jgi:uncharacterized repeat protein (TIGR02543 family)